ncbi:alpha/beta hydrolase [Luteolibacter arcticus]|uniref:Alpha/beta hydrolase n=1 Tax=Luteolibacter arcticus TaxID=1581411 RepID=A0ABT3GLX1_9BACT|nr:alpha/beta hydrolase [Luteolibacter arcticus]MCW1924513.1 alpha/beta hydrolase [Luteolibacter arcticus]
MQLLPVILFALAVAACAPARLERISERPRRAAASTSNDLHRAFDGASDPAATRALGRWLESAPGSESAIDGYLIRFHPGGVGIFPRNYFDKLEPASRYEVTGLNHHRVEGIGVPLIGHRENRHLQPVEKWYPPEGITRTVTAVAVPGPVKNGQRSVEIRLYDRLKTQTATIAGKPHALAGDFTVPWAALLENARPLARSGITAVLRKQSSREPGFALVEEYDPRRTPLICIHGLFSTPLAWAELTNELWADPAVRKRYQIWHYLYPTNAPALYSARVMRGQLDELRKFLDPGGDDPAMQRSVVIAHSNGGLLAKSLAVDPREAFWDAVFTRPLSSLDVTRQERRTLDEAFYWKPRTHVDRIIFCSVPFRGSNWANSWLGRFGQRLAAQDDRFQDFFRGIEKKNPGMLQPDYQQLTRGKITSIGALSPKQRSMEIFDALPLVRGTAGHVISGSRDLFVAPSSSSLPGAESSLEVPAGHGSFHHPQAIAEIKRILALPPAK